MSEERFGRFALCFYCFCWRQRSVPTMMAKSIDIGSTDGGDDNHYGEKYLKPVSNTAYTDHCGACHFAYQPELLPSYSWRKILENSQDHFGETLDLDADAREEIYDYLTSNAANTSSSKLSKKIMCCLDGRTPLRITDIPYIRKEHHEIGQSILNPTSVGSLSNCIACHRNADSGVYDDDRVSILE